MAKGKGGVWDVIQEIFVGGRSGILSLLNIHLHRRRNWSITPSKYSNIYAYLQGRSLDLKP